MDWLYRLFIKDYQNTTNGKVRENYGFFASVFGIVGNATLVVMKIIVGILSGMYSILADSINNLSDFGNNALSIIGVKLSNKKADDEHPFGHQRIEYVISLIISCVIIALGAIMVYQGILDLIAFIVSMVNYGHPLEADSSVKSSFLITLIVLLVAILLKVIQSLVYRSVGKRIDSLQFKALSKDSLNDVFSTAFVLLGLAISYFTGYVVDCFFTLIVSVLVICSGVSILIEAGKLLIGKKVNKEVIDEIVNLVLDDKDVLGMHDLSIHTYGKETYAICHLEVDSTLPLVDAHDIADRVEKKVKEKLQIHMTTHIDPLVVGDALTEEYRKDVNAIINICGFKKFHMHDFHVMPEGDAIKVSFDFVIPSEVDTEMNQQDLAGFLKNQLEIKTRKKIILDIDFDDSSTDFLSGTKAED